MRAQVVTGVEDVDAAIAGSPVSASADTAIAMAVPPRRSTLLHNTTVTLLGHP
jgi:hypothetical protein